MSIWCPSVSVSLWVSPVRVRSCPFRPGPTHLVHLQEGAGGPKTDYGLGQVLGAPRGGRQQRHPGGDWLSSDHIPIIVPFVSLAVQ